VEWVASHSVGGKKQRTDGGAPERDVKQVLGGSVRLALSVADRGHHSLGRTGGPLQV